MVEGITILTQTDIMTWPLWAVVVGALLAVTGVSFCVYGLDGGYDMAMIYLGLSILLILILFIIFISLTQMQDTGLDKYECVIADDVTLTEIDEYYEIVDKRGKIWILQDKEIGAND